MLIKQFLRDSLWYGLAFAGVATVEVLRVPVLGHVLGAERTGHFLLAYGLVMLLSTVGTSWLCTAIVRFLSAREQIGESSSVRLILRLSILTIAVVLGIGLLVAWITYPHLGGGLRSLVWPSLMLVASISLDRILLAVLRARREAPRAAAYSIAQSALGFAGGLAWVKVVDGGPREMLLAMFFASGFLLLVTCFLWQKSRVTAATEALALHSSGWEWWRYGLPLLGVNLLTWFLSNLDRYALQWVDRSSEVGPYAAVHYLSERSLFILTYFLSASVSPIVFAAWERGQREQVQQFLSQLIGYVFLAGIPLCALLLFNAHLILGLVLPSTFSAAFFAMPIIALGALLLCIGNVYSEIYTLAKQPARLFACYGVAVVTKCALLGLFVRAAGMQACAWATMAAYAVFALMTLGFSRRLLQVRWPWRALGCACAATAAMLLGARLVGSWVAVGSQVTVILWLILLGLLYLAGLAVLRDESLLGAYRWIRDKAGQKGQR